MVHMYVHDIMIDLHTSHFKMCTMSIYICLLHKACKVYYPVATSSKILSGNRQMEWWNNRMEKWEGPLTHA